MTSEVAAVPMNVELNSPTGKVFSDVAESVELRTDDGTISFDCAGDTYLNLQHGVEIKMRVGGESICFMLENAVGRLRAGNLSVLAEKVRSVAL